jgi:hypothetical protein
MAGLLFSQLLTFYDFYVHTLIICSPFQYRKNNTTVMVTSYIVCNNIVVRRLAVSNYGLEAPVLNLPQVSWLLTDRRCRAGCCSRRPGHPCGKPYGPLCAEAGAASAGVPLLRPLSASAGGNGRPTADRGVRTILSGES